MDCLDTISLMMNSCNPVANVTVTGITELKDKYIIILDNKHYLEADKSLLKADISNLLAREEINDIKSKIEALENKTDNDTIFDPTEIENKVQTFETVIGKIRDNLVEIGNAKDETTHKAFNKNFTL